MKKIGFSVLLLALSSFVYPCTTIIVGKKASRTGKIIFGRNSDTKSPSRAKHLKSYHTTAKSIGFLALPYYDTESQDGMLQVATNKKGVAISATETITSNDTALKYDPFVDNGISEFNLVKPIMDKATSAFMATKMLGDMITKQGVSEGFGVVLADGDEAWYLETGSGHHFVAVRIPDDVYFVSANQGRIQAVNIHNGVYGAGYYGSPDLESFARSHGFAQYTNNKFDFRKTYQRIINVKTGNMNNDINYNYYRIATLLNMYSKYPMKGFEKGEFPMFMKPTHKLTLTDVKRGLENYYQNTPYNPYISTESPTYRPISVFRSSNSHITVMSNEHDKNIANIEYIALGMPSSSLYIPFYSGMATIPKTYTVGTNKADESSAFWDYRKLQALVFTDFKHNQPIVRRRFDEFEARLQIKQLTMEKKYRKTHDLKVIQEFTDTTVAEGQHLTNELTRELEAHYNMTHDKKLDFTNSDYDNLVNEYYQKYPFKGF